MASEYFPWKTGFSFLLENPKDDTFYGDTYIHTYKGACYRYDSSCSFPTLAVSILLRSDVKDG